MRSAKVKKPLVAFPPMPIVQLELFLSFEL
jgi:hypothetical protein